MVAFDRDRATAYRSRQRGQVVHLRLLLLQPTTITTDYCNLYIKFCIVSLFGTNSFGLGASAEHARKVAKAKPDCVLRVASTNSATETLIETEMEQRRCACHRHSNTVRDLKCPRLLCAPGVGGVKRNKSCGRASAAAGARASGLGREGGAHVGGCIA